MKNTMDEGEKEMKRADSTLVHLLQSHRALALLAWLTNTKQKNWWTFT
jgi:hypothetical protein